MIKKKIIALFFLSTIVVLSQEKDVDLMDLIKEIQQVKKVESNMKMVWWIPTEYWRISTKGSPLVTEEGMKQLTEIVEPFTIIAALDGDIGIGNLNYKDTLSISLFSGDKQQFSPLNNDEIPNEAKNILRTLKPVLVNMIGEMGRNMNLYVFPNIGDEGDKIISPSVKGEFRIELNEEDFNWILPLNSFVAKKECPVDNKLMSGVWRYCPWHGTELVD